MEYDPQSPEALNNKGIALAESGNYKASLDKFKTAIMSGVNHYEIWFNRGKILFITGRYDDAITSATTAIELKQDLASAWIVKGMSLQALNRIKKANEAFAKAKELGYTG